MRKIVSLLIAAAVFCCCENKKVKMEKELKDFISRHEKEVVPIIKECNIAFWNAAVSGKEEDYKKAEELQLQLVKIYSNKEDFAVLKKIRESNAVEDSILLRQLKVFYNYFLKSMADTALLQQIVSMEVNIEKKYSNFRAEWNGKKFTDNDIEDILSKSTDDRELKNAWTEHKKIGPLVNENIITLVKKRNEMARSLGFSNYHTMSLTLSEQDPEVLEKLFDELDSLTLGSFIKAKDEIDEFLAGRLKIKKEALMPWHYQNRFFQEAPSIYKTDFDAAYNNKDIIGLTTLYYQSIGLDITDILEHSDLFEKTGKNQHAFCIDIDNEGDVRVLCNLKNNSKWMSTMLHEYGHAVYDKYIDTTLPFFLREPAHTFTTEAIAMMFGRMASNPQWLLDMNLIDSTEKKKIEDDCFNNLRLEQLVFSRWVQVMYRFEKSMYADPGQDLNALWWTLAEKYQLIRKPEGRNEPDWATKIHIATSPCYYHNYLLGELLASQLYYYINEKVIHAADIRNQSFKDRAEAGTFLVKNVFVPGNRYEWNEMIKRATGEELTPKYYARQFIQ